MEKKKLSLRLLVGMKTGIAMVKTVWRYLRKLKIELPYDPVIPLLGNYANKTKTLA